MAKRKAKADGRLTAPVNDVKLSIRIPGSLDRDLATEADKSRRKKGDLARLLLEQGLARLTGGRVSA